MSMRYQAGVLTASYFPLKVPNAPTIGTATAGNASASVTFTAPSNVGGGAITGYVAVATNTSSGATVTGTGASSPVTVSGLTNGNSYTVKVAAVNAYGTGPLSAASNSVTPEP
jgi:predicted phage tail protein